MNLRQYVAQYKMQGPPPQEGKEPEDFDMLGAELDKLDKEEKKLKAEQEEKDKAEKKRQDKERHEKAERER